MRSNARKFLIPTTNVYQQKLISSLAEDVLTQFQAWRRAGHGGRLRDAIRELYGVQAEKSGKESLSVDVAEAADLFEYLTASLRKNLELLDSMRTEHEQFLRVFGLAPSGREQRRLILEYAARLGATKRGLRKDQKAFGRWFDHDAVAERYHRKFAELEQLTALLLEAVGRSGETLLQAVPSDHEGSIGPLWRQLGIETIFVDLVHNQINYRVRIGLCEMVARVGLALPLKIRATLMGEIIVSGISRLAIDPARNVWLQAAAMEALFRLKLPDAESILRMRLVNPVEGDDLFVRRRAVNLLASTVAERPDLKALRNELLPISAKDPCPFVRQGAAGALARSDDMITATRELSRLALRDDEPSVRAAALVEGIETVGNARSRSWFVSLLCHMLAREADPFVIRTTLHVAAEWCERLLCALGERTPIVDEVERTLVPVIRNVRESAESVAVRRWAAAASEQIWVSLTPEARRLRDTLDEKFASLEPGRRARLPRSAARLLATRTEKHDERFVLGRVLAVAAREDFGFDIEHGVFGWMVRRGGEHRFRLWRLLFEMIRPSPEKRAAFSHTTGRVSEANFRVPSGILAEVSPTKVPGEPLLQADEQSWRPYLPLVDDVLSSLNQWFRVQPVQFFTTEGVTTLMPPRWWPRRVLAWIRLTLRFYRYAERRNWREGDLAAADSYVRSLRALGVGVHFEAYSDANGEPVVADPSVLRFFLPCAVEEQTDKDPTEENRADNAYFDQMPDQPAAEPVPVGAEGDLLDTSTIVSGSTPIVFSGLIPGFMPQGLDSQLQTWFTRYVRYFTSVYENTVPQLFVFALMVFALFFLRQWYLTWQVRRARRNVRLSIGGWGTRGKSGTERLKAALFNALGWGLVSKSSGCEAMFLYGPPWGQIHELGLYRPYDKATIWEHHAVMRLAGNLDASIFLWECMGLNPTYVRILQHEWSQDDLATITNAYPDHEDIQGPAGINVAETISRFIPPKARMLTSEHQMRPVLSRQARSVGTSMRKVGWLEAGLLTPDILKRFPYDEHPDNIALTTLMADELGVPTDFALKEMADRIVPDIGVLKTYDDAMVRTRRLAFTNGMSANERHGCLGNWTRLGFDRSDSQTEPDVWITTVVNNRADRIARSQVFASILVQDLSADRHVLIGGNLDALQTYIWQAFDRFVAGLSLWPAEGSDSSASVVLEKMARRFRIPTSAEEIQTSFRIMVRAVADATTEVIADELEESLLPHWDDPQRVAGLLRGAGIEEDLVGELQQHLTERIERLTEYRDFASRLIDSNVSKSTALDEDYRRLLREWFQHKLVVVDDYHATGEQIIDLLVTQTPPGFRNRIMGLQNIKGTGLDFVYRWLSWQKCSEACDLLMSQREEEFRMGLRLLGEFREYGQLCEDRVHETLDTVHQSPLAQQERVRTQLDLIRVQFEGAMHQLARQREHGSSRQSHLRFFYRWLDEFADPTDAVRRRRKADRIYRDLADQRISVERAAAELRSLSQRQKTGWIAAISKTLGEETTDRRMATGNGRKKQHAAQPTRSLPGSRKVS